MGGRNHYMESQTFFDIIANPIITIAIGFAYIVLAITASNVLNSRISEPDKKISLIICTITTIILIGAGISWFKQPELTYNPTTDTVQFKTIENRHYQQNKITSVKSIDEFKFENSILHAKLNHITLSGYTKNYNDQTKFQINLHLETDHRQTSHYHNSWRDYPVTTDLTLNQIKILLKAIKDQNIKFMIKSNEELEIYLPNQYLTEFQKDLN